MAGNRARGDGHRGLPRGPQALPRAEVAADQRERLFDALLELVNERGFAGVTISALVSSAGISRRSFYEHFENKEQCLLAAFDDSVERLTRRIAEGFDPGEGWNGQIEGIVRALFDATAERPQAARLVCVEVSAAGPEGVARWAQGAARMEQVLGAMFEQAPGPGTIPEPVAKAVVGALRKILYARVLSAKPGRGLRTELNRALPGLVGWISSYYPTPPGVPHRPRRRRTGRAG
ncbi:MAG: TetR/AcrR family transcriptional regulator, partial [Solirubrobacterales bacterium]